MVQQRRKPSSLRVASWNLVSFTSRKRELQEILQRLDIDVMALQETRLAAGDQSKIPGYDTYRKDRNRRGGGVAIAIKKGIQHHSVHIPQIDTIEAVAVGIVTERWGEITVISCYRPPTGPILVPDVEALLSAGPRLVAIGDFNAKANDWNSNTTNQAGAVLKRFLEAMDDDVFAVGPVEPTYDGRGHQPPDVLDIALLKAIPMATTIETLFEGSADHNPVLLTLGNNTANRETVVKRQTNWTFFKAEMQQGTAIPQIESEVDLEAAVLTLETDIKTALERSTTETVERFRQDYVGEIPVTTKQLIRQRRAARRRASRTGDPVDKNIANQLSRRVKAALDEHFQENWKRHTESLNVHGRDLWQTQKALRTVRRTMPPIHGARGVARTNRDKAEAFADSFELQCSENNLDDEDEEHTETIERRFRRLALLPDNDEIRPTSPEEIKEILMRLNPRKAPGHDGIRNGTLKALPRKGVVALTNIINASLRLRCFPSRWKWAEVVMIPKPGKDLRFPSNHRPISLLPTMAKVTERVIQTRISEISEEIHVIPDEQFAFRRGHSTELQVLRLVEKIVDGFNHKQVTAAVFLDVAKAFDRVWHAGLVVKMLDAGFPVGVVNLIRAYLQDRKARVRINEERSTYRDLEAGVPQGAVLSPHLYNVYTSDLPRTERSEISLYADDTALTARSSSSVMARRYLQRATDDLSDWCNRWKVAINAEKSKSIIFSRRPSQRRAEPIVLNDEGIAWTDRVKYLGVHLDKSLRWGPHIAETIKIAKSTRGRLYPLLCGESRLGLRNKLLLIKTVLQPQITYASAAWGHAAVTHRRKLQTVENIALRTAVQAPWFIRNSDLQRDLNWTPAAEIIRTLSTKTLERAAVHDNPLIREAVDYDLDEAVTHKRPRHFLIDPG